MHVCQRASALPVYNSILSSAFRVRFIMSSHKHIMLSIQIGHQACLPTPSSYCQLRYHAIQPTPYPHTVQACPSTTLHVSRITVAQAISSANFVSRYQKPTLSNLSTASIHVKVRITVTKPSATVSALSINSKRIWKPAGCVITIPLRTYSTRIVTVDGHPACRWTESRRRISSMHADG